MKELNNNPLSHVNDNNSNDYSIKIKDSIFDSALTLFAEYGFNGTTSKMIAELSGYDVKEISKYFGTKKGLYDSILKEITNFNLDFYKSQNVEIKQLIESNSLTKQKSREMILNMFRSVVKLYVSNAESSKWSQFMIRIINSQDEGFDYFYNSKMSVLYDSLGMLFQAYTGLDSNSLEIKVRIQLILSPLTCFILNKQLYLKHFGVEYFDDRTINIIQEIILRDINLILDGYD